jgi:glycine oxidase
MVARIALLAGERCGKASVRQETTGASGSDGDVVVPLRRLRSNDGGRDHLDAVIVGAGTIGLACAWEAARRGLRVRVLERDEPGAGATHVAAGMLAPVGEADWGEEAMVRMSTASARAWPEFAAELERETGLESGYETRGALHVALDRDEAEELRRRFELMSSLDLGVEWLRPRECRELEPSLSVSCTAGVVLPGEAAVDPRLLVRALVNAVEGAGGEVLSRTEVVDPILEGDRLAGVVTAEGREHRADRVVLATGAWSGAASWLPPSARPPVRPVKGQVLVLRGSPEQVVATRIVTTERVYVVPRSDGRLVVGATVEERGFDLQVTAGGVHELLREAYRTLPDIAELELVEALAGLRPGTPDNAPLVGPGALDGLVLATGHYRNGVLLTPVTADAVAAMLDADPVPPDARAAHPGRLGADIAPGLAAAREGEEVSS